MQGINLTPLNTRDDPRQLPRSLPVEDLDRYSRCLFSHSIDSPNSGTGAMRPVTIFVRVLQVLEKGFLAILGPLTGEPGTKFLPQRALPPLNSCTAMVS